MHLINHSNHVICFLKRCTIRNNCEILKGQTKLSQHYSNLFCFQLFYSHKRFNDLLFIECNIWHLYPQKFLYCSSLSQLTFSVILQKHICMYAYRTIYFKERILTPPLLLQNRWTRYLHHQAHCRDQPPKIHQKNSSNPFAFHLLPTAFPHFFRTIVEVNTHLLTLFRNGKRKKQIFMNGKRCSIALLSAFVCALLLENFTIKFYINRYFSV